MDNFWNWYISLFYNETNSVRIAAWSATLATITLVINFIFKPLYAAIKKKVKTENETSKREENTGSNPMVSQEKVDSLWSGIRPTESRFSTVTKIADSIPTGIQSFTYEYGPYGHVHPLILKGLTVRAEILFTCQIVNLYKAMVAANEYALNVLPPKLLLEARPILEKYSLPQLRSHRQEASQKILTHMIPQFEELGFELKSVTIGALDEMIRVNRANKK